MKDEGTQYMDLLRGTTELPTYSTLGPNRLEAGPHTNSTYRDGNLQLQDMFRLDYLHLPCDQVWL